MSKARAKGTRWESRLLPHLQAVFPYAERAPLRGSQDRGDFVHTGNFAVEAKNCKAIDLAGWIDEARAEARRAGPGVWPVVVFPRRNMGAERAYVVMELETWLSVAHRLEYGPHRASY
jgi:hypothetical protein